MTTLYALQVPAPEDADALLNTLSPSRRDRAAAIRHPQARARSVAAGLLLKALLGDKTAELTADSLGKPTVPGVHFNLSHSGDWAVCALSDGPVGVDVEQIKAHSHRLTRGTCTPDELARLRTPEDFCRLWAAKESFLKYLGSGLTISPRRVEVDVARGTVTLDGVPQPVTIREYPLAGCALTVCAQTPNFAPKVIFLSSPFI